MFCKVKITCDGVDDQKQVAGGESRSLKGGEIHLPKRGWNTSSNNSNIETKTPESLRNVFQKNSLSSLLFLIPGNGCHGPLGRPPALPAPPSWRTPAQGCAHTHRWTFNMITGWQNSQLFKKQKTKLFRLSLFVRNLAVKTEMCQNWTSSILDS